MPEVDYANDGVLAQHDVGRSRCALSLFAAGRQGDPLVLWVSVAPQPQHSSRAMPSLHIVAVAALDADSQHDQAQNPSITRNMRMALRVASATRSVPVRLSLS